MSVWDRQPKRFEFWRAVSTMSHTTFLAGVFFMFLPVGLLTDISRLGSDSVPRLIAETFFAASNADPVTHPRTLPCCSIRFIRSSRNAARSGATPAT